MQVNNINNMDQIKDILSSVKNARSKIKIKKLNILLNDNLNIHEKKFK